MASTYSDLKIELIGTGEQTGTWGATTNNNFSVAVGEAITGSADVVFSSADATVTLTDTNAAQTARNLRLNLTGTSGGARQLILGTGCQIEKLYLINNGLADAVTVLNASYSGVAVSTITFVTTTATATTSSNHGLTTGQTIVMTGCTPAAYNGTFVVTVTGLTTFQYIMLSTPATNATVVGSYTTSGTSVVVPAGKSMFVYNKGINVVEAVTGAVNLSVGTLAVTGTSTFAGDSTYNGTGQVKLPAGTTAERSGTPTNGMIRYNSTNGQFEGYQGGVWGALGGGATGGGSDEVFVENGVTVTTNYTLSTNKNAESVGPITINSGVVVTIPSGQRWVIL